MCLHASIWIVLLVVLVLLAVTLHLKPSTASLSGPWGVRTCWSQLGTYFWPDMSCTLDIIQKRAGEPNLDCVRLRICIVCFGRVRPHPISGTQFSWGSWLTKLSFLHGPFLLGLLPMPAGRVCLCLFVSVLVCPRLSAFVLSLSVLPLLPAPVCLLVASLAAASLAAASLVVAVLAFFVPVCCVLCLCCCLFASVVCRRPHGSQPAGEKVACQ